LLAERIQAFTKARQWSLNEVLLHALRRGLGLAETPVDAGELTMSAGPWNAVEQAVFRETVQALSIVRGDALLPVVREA